MPRYDDGSDEEDTDKYSNIHAGLYDSVKTHKTMKAQKPKLKKKSKQPNKLHRKNLPHKESYKTYLQQISDLYQTKTNDQSPSTFQSSTFQPSAFQSSAFQPDSIKPLYKCPECEKNNKQVPFVTKRSVNSHLREVHGM